MACSNRGGESSMKVTTTNKYRKELRLDNCFRSDHTMNLKLTNHMKNSTTNVKSAESLVKEERRRTGRYIAILVGIMLFILAIYHAWVRRIPVVASLVVPALIMFVYVAWVLYSASKARDKLRMLDAEAALNALNHEGDSDIHISEVSQNLDTNVTSKELSNLNTPEDTPWTEISTAFLKIENNRTSNGFVLPIILINDKPAEDTDQKWMTIVEKVSSSDKLRVIQNRKKYKRKYCRKRRYAAFKRSYSIG